MCTILGAEEREVRNRADEKQPCGESIDHFKNVILDCKNELRKTTKGKKGADSLIIPVSPAFLPLTSSSAYVAVVYQVNQVGKDPAAENFVKGLHEDPELKDIMYCTSGRLTA